MLFLLIFEVVEHDESIHLPTRRSRGGGGAGAGAHPCPAGRGGFTGRGVGPGARRGPGGPEPAATLPGSAVDGYAVRAADGAGRLRVAGESAAGRPFEGALPEGAAARILTGGVLPVGADTVVMVEDVVE